MKTVNGKTEILAFRKEISVEELKNRKDILDSLAARKATTNEEKERQGLFEDLARLTDTALVNHYRWKQEHQLSCDLAKALIQVLGISGDKELQDEHMDLLDRAKKHKCFEFTEKDLEKMDLKGEDCCEKSL